ncbi:uncharacterized protein [Rhodnius prolixus]|uniref:uncharacterized protein n=1 Tax=Rhodnius prolixus TaxID=13249 RepID=UPI003D18ADF6
MRKNEKDTKSTCDNLFQESSNLNLLLCCSGKITKEQMQGMLLSMTNLSTRTEEFHFRVVLTEQSRTNINNDYISKLTEMVYTDEDEWNLWQRRGDPVLHIDLTKWADVLVVAPLDMNTLAKIAVVSD